MAQKAKIRRKKKSLYKTFELSPMNLPILKDKNLSFEDFKTKTETEENVSRARRRVSFIKRQIHGKDTDPVLRKKAKQRLPKAEKILAARSPLKLRKIKVKRKKKK